MLACHVALGLMFLTAGRPEPPVIIPDASVIALDDIGLYSVGYAYRNQPEQSFPLGWNGQFDERTGVTCQEWGLLDGKQSLLLHCPWRGGVGVTFQEYRFEVPNPTRRVVLKGATAMRPDALGPDKSDGATFRVYANGKKLLDVHRADATWKPFEFDLGKPSGGVLTVRFETDPGPRDDSSFDFSLWGDRQIVFEGFSPKPPVSHPAPPALSIRALWPRTEQGAVPPSALVHRNSVSREGDSAVLRYEGDDGTIEYRWSRPVSPDDPVLGRIEAKAQMKGDKPVTVPVATSARIEWSQAAAPAEARWITGKDRSEWERAVQVGNETATLRVTGRIIGKSLVFDVTCCRPDIARFDPGCWGPTIRRKTVPVPYLSNQVDFLPAENLFAASQLDWTESSATSHDNHAAVYLKLTNGERNLLKERVVFTAAWHLDEVLPNIPNAPSPFLKDLSDRVVLDIWGGRYEDIARKLETLADYGVSRCAVIIHDWQRSGYDNALPMHIPAASDKGGDRGMKVLVETGKKLGYLMALHENYVDYYPNYDDFNENDIALDSEGHRQNAWYNPETRIQSFAVKPNAILRLAETQSPEVHKRYGTNANYLDVHSAVPPWFHVDQRAGEEGAGTFRRVWDVHRQLWQYERATHGGPVFGEGNNHWYWSGLLDGAEAQFGSGWPSNQGQQVPLLVDFDLLKIHPLQFNHGMGYYERWWLDKPGYNQPTMCVLDQYRMQEAIFGHAGFLAGSTWSSVPLAWLEHHMLSPVMAQYATAKPVEIQYEQSGKWLDVSSSVRAGATFQRARVRYDNGLTITANQATEPLTVDRITLPQFGWIADGAGVTAGTTLRDGVVTDFAVSNEAVFANARRADDWDTSGHKRIRPSVTGFKATGPRSFSFSYRWRVRDRLPHDYTAFVHFGKPKAANDAESILFQQDHGPTVPTSKWKVGQDVIDGPFTVQVLANLPDGEYVWAIGLYRPGDARVGLEGDDDGTGRIRLGTLFVRDGGRSIAFKPVAEKEAASRAADEDHLNHKDTVVDFGMIRTDGSIWTRRDGKDWAAQVLPRDGRFTVELSAKRFGRPSQIGSKGGSQETVTPKAQGDWWSLPLNGAKEYRWLAQ